MAGTSGTRQALVERHILQSWGLLMDFLMLPGFQNFSGSRQSTISFCGDMDWVLLSPRELSFNAVCTGILLQSSSVMQYPLWWSVRIYAFPRNFPTRAFLT